MLMFNQMLYTQVLYDKRILVVENGMMVYLNLNVNVN